MINEDFLKRTLTKLAKLQIALAKKGGPSEDGELFEKILEIQEDVLTSFGLPISSVNEELILFNTLPTDTEVNERIKLLQKSATAYLLSNAKSELQTLKEAQELKQDSSIVLPELKVTNHIYTLFVYNKILLEYKDSLENILQELKFTNHPDILNALGRLGQGTLEDKSTVIDILKAVGVKYIDQFMLDNSNH